MKNIKLLRAKMNMSQQELSDKVGVSRTTMNTWENSLTSLGTKNEQKLLDIFNCNIYELYGMDEFKHYPKDNASKMGIIKMLFNLLDEEEKANTIFVLQQEVGKDE